MRLICWNNGGCKNNSNLPEYYGCGGETEKVVQCCAEYNGFYDTIETLRQEKEQLKAELAHYKQEAIKIPKKCRHAICVWEKNEYEYRNHPDVWEWVLDWRRKCPQICPKWREGGI